MANEMIEHHLEDIHENLTQKLHKLNQSCMSHFTFKFILTENLAFVVEHEIMTSTEKCPNQKNIEENQIYTLQKIPTR